LKEVTDDDPNDEDDDPNDEVTPPNPLELPLPIRWTMRDAKEPRESTG
jgi:hypothetical protein